MHKLLGKNVQVTLLSGVQHVGVLTEDLSEYTPSGVDIESYRLVRAGRKDLFIRAAAIATIEQYVG